MVSLVVSLLAAVGLAGEVVDLTSDNFDAVVAEEPAILVEFFAPWCGHCKNLAPKYDAAAKELGDIAKIAKVDCTDQASLCSKYEVRGYPTLKLFRGDEVVDYASARETDAIVSYMKKAVLPAVSAVSAEEVAEFSAKDKVVVVGFFAEDSDEAKTFAKVAEKHRDNAVFGSCADEAAAKEAGSEFPGFVLFKKFDEGKNVFSGDFTAEAAGEFISTNSVPLMDYIGPQNYGKYVESGLPLAYFFVTEEQKESHGSIVEAVAQDFKGKVNFVYIDASQYGTHANNLNLKAGQWPAFAIQDPEKDLKFPFSQENEITEDAIRTFVTGVADGTIAPTLKSEPIPESQEGPVTVVVGDNFDSIVMEEGKNVFIEFYAPWCGHCKKLAPTWDELAEKYADDDSVVIAKMDATENDIPPQHKIKVSGFPTLIMIDANNKKVDYSGNRDLDGFEAFLTANAVAAKADDAKDEL